MSLDFQFANDWINSEEGIKSDDPGDKGGLTKWGIASASYPDVLRPEFSYQDAIAIRKRDFWDKAQCGAIRSAGVALILYDAVINQTGSSIKNIQIAVGATPDGIMGPDTLRRINAGPGLRQDLMIEFAALRMMSYATDPDFKQFGHGWSRRLMRCLATAVTFPCRKIASVDTAFGLRK